MRLRPLILFSHSTEDLKILKQIISASVAAYYIIYSLLFLTTILTAFLIVLNELADQQFPAVKAIYRPSYGRPLCVVVTNDQPGSLATYRYACDAPEVNQWCPSDQSQFSGSTGKSSTDPECRRSSYEPQPATDHPISPAGQESSTPAAATGHTTSTKPESGRAPPELRSKPRLISDGPDRPERPEWSHHNTT